MSTESTSGASFSHLVTKMGDEGEYQMVENARPLRASGYVCLILGIASVASLFGLPLLAIPVAALLVGVFALRKYTEPEPAGVPAARVGMILAIMFGVACYVLHSSRYATLSDQAEQYAKFFTSTMAVGEPEIAMELMSGFVGRQNVPLKPLYVNDEAMMLRMNEFKNNGVYGPVSQLDGEADWKVTRPTKVWQSYGGLQKAQVCLKDAEDRIDLEIQVFLSMVYDREGNMLWNVYHVQPYRERIVSAGIL